MELKKKIANSIKGYVKFQLADMSSVEPTVRWDGHKRVFFMNSSAGFIRFKPKKPIDIERFRNTWVNRFMLDREDRKRLFKLYRDIRRQERVSYRANLNTRVKDLLRAI